MDHVTLAIAAWAVIATSGLAATLSLWLSERGRRSQSETRESELREHLEHFVLRVAELNAPEPAEIGQTEGLPDVRQQYAEDAMERDLNHIREGLKNDQGLTGTELEEAMTRIEEQYAQEMFPL